MVKDNGRMCDVRNFLVSLHTNYEGVPCYGAHGAYPTEPKATRKFRE